MSRQEQGAPLEPSRRTPALSLSHTALLPVDQTCPTHPTPAGFMVPRLSLPCFHLCKIFSSLPGHPGQGRPTGFFSVTICPSHSTWSLLSYGPQHTLSSFNICILGLQHLPKNWRVETCLMVRYTLQQLLPGLGDQYRSNDSS